MFKMWSALMLVIALVVACSPDPSPREVIVPEFSVLGIDAQRVRYDSVFNILGSDFPNVPEGIRVNISGVDANFTILNDTLMKVLVARQIPSGPGVVKVFRLDQEVFSGDLRILFELVRDTVVNFPARFGSGDLDSGPFRRFDFTEGGLPEELEEWDLAFRGTTLAVNGGEATGTEGEPLRTGEAGASLLDIPYQQINSASDVDFTQDGPEGFAIADRPDEGWFYLDESGAVLPVDERTLVVRTRDGRFAKVKFLNYYQNAPQQPDPDTDAQGYYSFAYTFNPNFGENYLE